MWGVATCLLRAPGDPVSAPPETPVWHSHCQRRPRLLIAVVSPFCAAGMCPVMWVGRQSTGRCFCHCSLRGVVWCAAAAHAAAPDGMFGRSICAHCATHITVFMFPVEYANITWHTGQNSPETVNQEAQSPGYKRWQCATCAG